MDIGDIAKAVGGWQPLTVFLVCLVAGPLAGAWIAGKQYEKMADRIGKPISDALAGLAKAVESNTTATQKQTTVAQEQTSQLVELRRESRDNAQALDRIDRRLLPRNGGGG